MVVPAVVAVLLCLAAFQWRDARLGGLELLDVRQWYTPEQAAALFGALDRLDPRARGVYAWTEVTVDLITLDRVSKITEYVAHGSRGSRHDPPRAQRRSERGAGVTARAAAGSLSWR